MNEREKREREIGGVLRCSLLSCTYRTQLTQAIKEGEGREGGVPLWHLRWCCLLLLYPILEALASRFYWRQGCCSCPSSPSPRPASGVRVCVRVVVAVVVVDVVVAVVVVVALQRQLHSTRARTPAKEERQE